MIQVGDTLWYVRNHGENCEITVSKLGRKWIHAGKDWWQERFDIETMQADGKGYSPPGKAYFSKEEYEKEMEVCKAWQQFCNDIKYSQCPDGVTVTDIQQARELLNCRQTG